MAKAVIKREDLDQFIKNLFDVPMGFDEKQYFMIYLKKQFGAPIKEHMIYEYDDDFEWKTEFNATDNTLTITWEK